MVRRRILTCRVNKQKTERGPNQPEGASSRGPRSPLIPYHPRLLLPRFLGDVVFVADVRGIQIGGFAAGDLFGEPLGFFTILQPHISSPTIPSPFSAPPNTSSFAH